MSKKIKWGILGLGNIANKFATDLLLSETSTLHAVASRSMNKASNFAKRFGAVKYYGTYRELAADPEIDVVYIATPHPLHFENTMMCLENGKSVLCEKPLAMNLKQVSAMIDKAKETKLFLMEAMWTRFLPLYKKIMEIVKNGEIGKIIYTKADFGFVGDTDPEKRVYNKELGGGSLLDIGIYPLYLSQLFLGTPSKIQATARMFNSGVDSFLAALLDFKNGEKAIVESTFEVKTANEGFIYGDKGSIKLHSPFHHPPKISVFNNDELTKEFEFKSTGYGYYYEIEEVNSCLEKGSIESPSFSHQDSIDLITSIDRIKKIIGLKYDAD